MENKKTRCWKQKQDEIVWGVVLVSFRIVFSSVFTSCREVQDRAREIKKLMGEACCGGVQVYVVPGFMSAPLRISFQSNANRHYTIRNFSRARRELKREGAHTAAVRIDEEGENRGGDQPVDKDGDQTKDFPPSAVPIRICARIRTLRASSAPTDRQYTNC